MGLIGKASDPLPTQPSRVHSSERTILFVRAGDFWTIGSPGATFSLRDVKGFAYLLELLRYPGREFHSLDLLGHFEAAGSETPSNKEDLRSTTIAQGGDAGALLDARAKAEYKRRLQDLSEELRELRNLGMDERADRVESEIDTLTGELARAFGLGGRDRRAGSATERARLNVQRAIKSAIGKIADHDRSLAEFLSRSIKTGGFCSYAAEANDGLRWQFGLEDSSAKPSPPAAETFEPRAPARIRWVAESNPFVGRLVEEEVLARNLEIARRGEGRVVTIAGEAGVGKTRLSREFCQHATSSGFLALAGSCYDRKDSVPFIPFVEILEAAMSRSTSPEAFRIALGADAPELARLMPQLRSLFADIDAPLEATPEQSRRLLLNAVVSLVTRVSSNAPLLLLIEDLQWADEGTFWLLEHLARATTSLPIMIVMNCRANEGGSESALEEGLYGLSRLPGAERINLRGLAGREVTLMIEAMSQRHPPPTLAAAIYSATEGNPLFVKELYEHLADRGKLFDSNGDFLRYINLDDEDVPHGLKLLIGRRLSRLSDGTRKILCRAATIGRSFSFDLLEACCGIDADTLLEHVEEAEDVGVLNSGVEYREAKFWFSHELVRQAILTDVSPARKQRFHLVVADAIERIYDQSLENHAMDLAHHLSRAGTLAKADRTIKYLAMAARRAMTQSAYQSALVHLKTAIDLVSNQPEAERVAANELWLQIAYGSATVAVMGWAVPEAGRAYARAQELCEKMGETPDLFPVLYGLVGFHFVRGDYKTAAALAERMIEMAEKLDDDHLRIEGNWLVGLSSFYMGDCVRALTHFEKGISIDQRDANPGDRVAYGEHAPTASLCYSAFSNWCMGRSTIAEKQARDTLVLARSLSHPFSLAWTFINLVLFYILVGDWSMVSVLSEEGETLAKDQGFALFAVSFEFFKGAEMAASGKLDEGIAQMRRTIASYRAMGAEMLVPWNHSMLAEALGRAGRFDEARQVLDEAFEVMNRTDERHYEIEMHRVRADLLRLRSQVEGASSEQVSADQAASKASFGTAIQIARSRQAIGFELRSALGLAQLLQGQGDSASAAAVLRETYGRFSEELETAELQRAAALLKELE
jgi:predicted ATPase